MSEHVCQPPSLTEWDDADDWTCPDCGAAWWVAPVNYCHSCYRQDGQLWERHGKGDGKFPLVTAPRGGIQFKMTGDKS